MSNSKPKSSWNLSIGIYALCLAIIGAFAATNISILNSASAVADRVQYDVEADLVRNETELQLRNLASDQAEFSYWDEAVYQVYRGEPDPQFVLEEMVDVFWDDYEIEHAVVVGIEGQPELTVFRDELMDAADAAQNIADNFDLIQTARVKYFANRKVRGRGFVPLGDPVWSNTPIYAVDYRVIEGRLGVAVAQAIVPDILEVLPDGNPKVLFTFRPLNKFSFAAVRDQLGLSRFAIVEKSQAELALDQLEIGGKPDAKVVAVWEAAKPSATIWEQAVPMIGALAVLISAGLLFFAIRYGKVVQRIQESEAHNRFMAEHDALTGLPNRLQFDMEVEKIISKGEQDRCAIICTDLDKFKLVNDTFGHQAGDAVIKTVAQRIAKQVGDRGMTARVGGDEFIILLRNGLDSDEVHALCDNIIESVSQQIVFDNGEAAVGASIGVAWWPDDAMTAKTVIRSADQALYRAKELGRGQTVSAKMQVKSRSNDPVKGVSFG